MTRSKKKQLVSTIQEVLRAEFETRKSAEQTAIQEEVLRVLAELMESTQQEGSSCNRTTEPSVYRTPFGAEVIRLAIQRSTRDHNQTQPCHKTLQETLSMLAGTEFRVQIWPVETRQMESAFPRPHQEVFHNRSPRHDVSRFQRARKANEERCRKCQLGEEFEPTPLCLICHKK